MVSGLLDISPHMIVRGISYMRQRTSSPVLSIFIFNSCENLDYIRICDPPLNAELRSL
jgi:hypothetical protein